MELLTPLWLTNVKYIEGKRAIAVEFSRLNFRRMVRLPFFPSFFVSRNAMSFNELKEALSFGKRRFRILERYGLFQVTAGTFSDLNNLADFLFKETGFRPVVLEPERQFLLEKGWSYFDCFTSFSEKQFFKHDRFSIPEVKLDLFSEPLHETLQQLNELDSKLGKKLLKSIHSSNYLRLPIMSLPGTESRKREIKSENLFWKKGLDVREKEAMVVNRVKSAPLSISSPDKITSEE